MGYHGKKSLQRILSQLMVCVMVIGLFCIPADKEKTMDMVEASGQSDISLTVTEAPVTADSENKVEVKIAKASGYNSMKSLYDAGYTTLEISVTISAYTAAADTPGIMPFVVYGSDYNWSNGDVWVNLDGYKTYILDLKLSEINTTDTGAIDHFGFQISGISGSAGYTVDYAKLLHNGSESGTGGSTGGGSQASDETQVINSDVTYNYAALLQESLYLYDANMCGTDVDENSAFSWRSDCHTGDCNVTYNGKTVDVSGGYHDAGDHAKFGLPQAYAASVLGMSYYQFPEAYESTGTVGHYTRIIERFVDYFERCTVLDDNGNVEAFCIQVGDGNIDHSYWGAPEKQDEVQGSRVSQAYFSSASDPATDIVSETAAALAIYYCNYKDTNPDKAATALIYAEKLFAYANSFSNKSCSSVATGFYDSDSWEDDYALAAAWLYRATGDSAYKTYYNNVYGSVSGVYWVMCWNNVSSAAVLYGPDVSRIGYVADYVSSTASSPVFDNNYAYVTKWGTARYNTALQFLGLAYDDIKGSDNFGAWAKGQMQYILGNNNGYNCYVVGYNDYSVKYPHHRAASGYSDVSSNDTTTMAHVLIGAMIGGPDSESSSYTDGANNYNTNEVALDYQAGCVAAAAGLYEYIMTHGTDEEKVAQTVISDESVLTSEMRASVVSANKSGEISTEAPTTEAPTTEAPTTEAPTTEAPTTEAPTTEAPTTEAPTTEAPTTEAPTTEAPTTEAPTTEAPTTEAPTTEAPTTEAPTTEAPTTEAPTTEAPTTEAPTTEAPTTEAPTTEAPTTEAPATEAPTTEAPTTEAPTTEAPTTEEPTTEKPVTLATPQVTSLYNNNSGIVIKWNKVSNADGYYVFRRVSGGSWKCIKKVSGGSTLYCTDTTATAGTVYAYTVRAYKGSVYSGYNKTGKGTIRLKTPAISKLANVSGGVKITWDKVAGAKGYYVYRRVSGGSWARVGTVTSGSQTSFTDKKAVSGTVYAYTVKAYYGSIYSAYNTTGKGVYYLAQPAPKAAASTGRVTVSWSKSGGASGYYVYRRVPGGSWSRIATVKGGSVTKYVDKTAKKGTRYYYTVRAYRGSYTSAYHPTGYVVIAK